MLPLVGSMSVSPGLMRPLFSASSTMRLPMRSLTEPPAFMNSHLPSSSHLRPAPMLLMRMSGVHPMWSRTVSLIFGRSQPGGVDMVNPGR